ncbi:flagellar M-ring protein FliF C-terminal domain-containing protein [Sphingosinicella soli]|uniref:Flagellar biosynthesis/type III secretory pathway M-ring protein FliF/YscJ n=1 Tax=Sphingosinicella soli TaxID=333708 RepID=A0A7W7B378_9SPHN|nr:flagellar M-ring protein FliF C-terminal domain-containing protein [Sphingosinicella soli]MBB4633136.1 flagellar biosynthesis/type III secretory pathway M-ring protein FliF/YscJ [Sphingosinicella soli]
MAVFCAVIVVLAAAALPARDPVPTPASPASVPDRQSLVETRLRERIESLIGTIVGRDNVRAIVSAEIEPDQTRQLSQAGEPGTNSTETTTIRSSGRIGRLTVSVMVNGRYVDGTGYHPRTEAELARFTRLAKDAAGFDALRGDSLSVETVRFAPRDTGSVFDALLPFAPAALAGLLGFAALLLVLRMAGRRAPEMTPTAAQDTQAPPPSPHEPFASDMAQSPALRRAGEAVSTRPAVAAAVVQRWMSA